MSSRALKAVSLCAAKTTFPPSPGIVLPAKCPTPWESCAFPSPWKIGFSRLIEGIFSVAKFSPRSGLVICSLFTLKIQILY